MSVMDVFGSIALFDKFDFAIGLIEWVEELVQDADVQMEFHPGDGPIPEGFSKVETSQMSPEDFSQLLLNESDDVRVIVEPHFFDCKHMCLDKLMRAKDMVREAELLTQEVLAVIP